MKLIRKIKETQFQMKFRKTLNDATDKMLVIMQKEIHEEQLRRQKELKKMKGKTNK